MRSVARFGCWAVLLAATSLAARPVAVVICPDAALEPAADTLIDALQIDGGYDHENILRAVNADDLDRLDQDPLIPEINPEDELLIVLAGGVVRTFTGQPELLARSDRVPLETLVALLLTAKAERLTILSWLATPDTAPPLELAKLLPAGRQGVALVEGRSRDFLTAIIAGLKTLTADADADGVVTVGELAGYARQQLGQDEITLTTRPDDATGWPLAGRGGPDVVPPLLLVTVPRLRDDGPVLLEKLGPMVVGGVVADDRRVAGVTVNAIPATIHLAKDPALDDLGFPGRTHVFEAAIPVAPSGFTEVEVVARDRAGNESRESFLILAGGVAGPAPGEGETTPPPSTFDKVTRVDVSWNQTEDWRYGFSVTPTVEVHGREGRRCRTMAQFRFRPNGAWLKDVDGSYAEPGGRVAAMAEFTPRYANARVEGPPIFVPQRELHLAPSRKHALEMVVTVWDVEGQKAVLLATSDPVPFDLQEPDQVATVFDFQIEHNQRRDNVRGVVLRTRFQVSGMKGQPSQIAIYFQHADGRPLMDRDNNFRAGDGSVAVFEDFTPPYAEADYKDYRLFLPYDQLDLNAKGDYPLRARAVIWNRTTRQALDASDWIYLSIKRD